MKASQLISQIRQDVLQVEQQCKDLLSPLDTHTLNAKPSPSTWSPLECLEHLNHYAAYYLPEISKSLKKAASMDTEVKYTWFGKKSLDLVTSPAKKKTLKKMDPGRSQLQAEVLGRFLNHQKEFLALLKRAEGKDLNGKKVRVEFMKLIRMRLGETIIFLSEHQKRHMKQATQQLSMKAAS